MLEYKGKYNKAKIMIDYLDESTITQIYSFLNHPAFEKMNIVIMPDCHAGSGSCIGFTATMNDFIIPSVIGVDISCGVDVWNLGHHKKKGIKFEKLDNFIRECIPAGTGKMHKEPAISEKEINALCPNLFNGIMKVCEKINLDKNSVINSIGSLGGGNHYIAIECDPNRDAWLNIHSGSRNFGLQIANYHQNKAREWMSKEFNGAHAFKGLEYLTVETGANEYIDDAKIAHQYALLNRRVMAEIIISGFFKKDMGELEHIESVHNYIDFDNKIIRKGAISAREGERVIIPLNMRDGSIVAIGKGNKDWNYSAPHGAGRVMSRNQAKKKITLSELRSQMSEAKIWTSCIDKSVLDEAPRAYKKTSLILDNIVDTVDVQFRIIPSYNFKGVT